MDDEPPDVDTLFDFLDPRIGDSGHVSPGITAYGVSFLSFSTASIHLVLFIHSFLFCARSKL
jgi:hypothetical protein